MLLANETILLLIQRTLRQAFVTSVYLTENIAKTQYVKLKL